MNRHDPLAAASLLIIDADGHTSRFLRPALHAAGYAITESPTPAAALAALGHTTPALILFDPGADNPAGPITQLRAAANASIVIISARADEAAKIAALDAGADDYVEKPVAIREFLARLRACRRRALTDAASLAQWRCESVQVDLIRRSVTVEARPVPLSPREFDLLALLVRNAGRVLTHRQLLLGVWGAAHGQDIQYVRVYIGHLRQKLGPDFAEALITESGIGYRLIEAAS